MYVGRGVGLGPICRYRCCLGLLARGCFLLSAHSLSMSKAGWFGWYLDDLIFEIADIEDVAHLKHYKHNGH